MKILKYVLLLMPVMYLATSCVREEDNIFDELPAVRMQKKIAEYRAALTGASNGWLISYYPEINYGAGGYTIYCKFSDDGTVETACEIDTKVPALEITKSTWDIIAYQGPTLTFDTYNPVIHFFSEVTSSSDRDGIAGDWDWALLNAETVKDTIYVEGVKYDNHFSMWKCSGDPIEYLRQVNTFATSIKDLKSFNLILGGTQIGEVTMASSVSNGVLHRKFNISYKNSNGNDTLYTVPFTYIPGVLVLSDPITINGSTVQNFTWDEDSHTFTSGNIQFIFSGKLPLTEDNIATYEPDPDVDVVIRFNPHVDYAGDAWDAQTPQVIYKVTSMSPKLEAWRASYSATFPTFEHFSLRFPRSGYDMSFVSTFGSSLWYWGMPSGERGFNRLKTAGHNPNYEVLFQLTRSSTVSSAGLPSGYNGTSTGAANLRELLQAATGFTVLQDGANFYLRSNADPNDWLKFEPM